jgi:putative transposase
MPRIRRGLGDDQLYHVINRGNGRARVFHKEEDYSAFAGLLGEAATRYPVRLFAYCLMPNHFHLLVSPHQAHQLSQWMQWLMTAHVRRYRAHYGGSGHIWQGRYKGFLIQGDAHLLAVARYVEGNSVRGGLAPSAAAWPWSSHNETIGAGPRALTEPLPTELPPNWTAYVDTPISEAELRKMRESVRRQTPYGDDSWQKSVSIAYHLESTLHPQGRPRKELPVESREPLSLPLA